MDEITNLKKQIEELLAWKRSLEGAQTIPLNIDQSFRKRFGNPRSSSKSASSENQAVNEAGASTYSVLKTPDGFIEVDIAGVTKYIPKYD